MRTFYNDNDRHAAAWMRELMAAGHITEGDVSETSIKDIRGESLGGYGRVHLFAGIAGWEYALRLAGWPADRPVFTGSCPCQPYSSAGKRKGGDDERHLWPEMFRLVRECRPATIFGEQVASNDGLAWLDGVCADLESEGYAVAASDLCAAGVGAPHIRQRLFWVAVLPVAQPAGLGNSTCAGRSTRDTKPCATGPQLKQSDESSLSGRMGDADDGRKSEVGGVPQGPRTEPPRGVERVAHPEDADGRGQGGLQPGGQHGQQPEDGGLAGRVGVAVGGRHGTCVVGRSVDTTRGESWDGQGASGAIDSGEVDFWGNYVVLPCRDGKFRRAERSIQPLVAGLPKGVVRSRDPGAPTNADSTSEARGMRLRGYGNSIVPAVAAKFIRAFLEAEKEMTP